MVAQDHRDRGIRLHALAGITLASITERLVFETADVDTESQCQNNGVGIETLQAQFGLQILNAGQVMHEQSERPEEVPPTDSVQPPTPMLEYDSAQLLHGHKEILIRHAGELYRLRLTRNGKLILQK